MEHNLYQTASTTTQTNNTNISFLCMICFDTFNKKTRAPVILPCGHTFICAQCSKRIKNCMECRTSLFLKPDKPKNVINQQQIGGNRQRSNSGYSPRTYRRHPHVRGSPEVNGKKPPPQEPSIPLPLPENKLMLTLLESANYVLHNKKEHKYKQHAIEEDNEDGDDDKNIVCVEIQEKVEEIVVNTTVGTPPRSTSINNEEVEIKTPAAVEVTSSSWSSEDDDEENNDAEKILIALETSLGSGGTYVVIDANGLDILPYKPKGYVERHNRNNTKDDDLECNNDDCDNLKLPAKLARLNYGDRVQVVDVQETTVKLARNKGYVIATYTQLVKITVPFDNACLIESHLISLQPKYRRLNRMLDKINTMEEHLLQDLNKSILQDDYPPFIIEPLPSHEEEEEDTDIRTKSPSSNKSRHVEFNLQHYVPPPPPPPPSYHHPEVIKPNRINDDEEFVTAAAGCTSFFGIGSHVDIDSDSSAEDNTTHYYTGIFCPSSNATTLDDTPSESNSPTNRATAQEQEQQARQSPPNTTTTTTSTSPNISPTRAPLPLDAVVSPFIDFRTGRSGHLALTSTKAQYPKKAPVYSRGIRMMSDHKGIGSIKSIHRNVATDSPYSTTRGGQRSSLSNKTW